MRHSCLLFFLCRHIMPRVAQLLLVMAMVAGGAAASAATLPHHSRHAHDGVSPHATFTSIATSRTPVTDKIRHGYGDVYDAYLTPALQASSIKLLEIGLGCDMGYGPGASSKIWPLLFPHADIWLADADEACVKRYWNQHLGWRYVVGDQSNRTVLASWLNTTGNTPFDIIIDDGGHRNRQIWASFDYLFTHALSPGGLYFIEDLHVNKAEPWYDGGVHHSLAMVDILQDWVQQLVLRSYQYAYDGLNATTRGALGLAYKTRLPDGVARIDCVQDMCVVSKKKG